MLVGFGPSPEGIDDSSFACPASLNDPRSSCCGGDRPSDSKASCGMCTLLHPANAGPFTLWSQALVHSILASSIKPVAPHKSIPETELLRPIGFIGFTRALSRSRKLSGKREK